MKKTKVEVKVVHQSGENSYTHLATKKVLSRWNNQVSITSRCDNQVFSLKEVFQSVERKEYTYGVLPLESSTQGTIFGVYDRLLASDGKIAIVGEVNMEEHYSLLSCANSRIEDISEVISHPHILESCAEYLDMLDSRRQKRGLSPMVRSGASSRYVHVYVYCDICMCVLRCISSIAYQN